MEGGSSAEFRRAGYTKQTLVEGTRIKATLNPLKHGRTDGNLVKIELPDAHS